MGGEVIRIASDARKSRQISVGCVNKLSEERLRHQEGVAHPNANTACVCVRKAYIRLHSRLVQDVVSIHKRVVGGLSW